MPLGLRSPLDRLLKECGPHKSINFSIEHSIRIPHFTVSPMIFDTLLRMKCVRSNLASEANLSLLSNNGGHFFLLLGVLPICFCSY